MGIIRESGGSTTRTNKVRGAMNEPETIPETTPETIEVTTRDVSCDGGGALGHPLVYLTIGAQGWVECGYCDRRFVLAPAPAR